MQGKQRKDIDTKKLELSQEVIRLHHQALWEEEKHFTWLISIVLSGQILIYISDNINEQGKLVFLFMGSLVGIVLCITALRVIRREGEFFNIALSRFVAEHNLVYNNLPLDKAPAKANKGILELVKLFLSRKKMGIRDCFQFLFVFFALVFVLITAYAFLPYIMRVLKNIEKITLENIRLFKWH